MSTAFEKSSIACQLWEMGTGRDKKFDMNRRGQGDFPLLEIFAAGSRYSLGGRRVHIGSRGRRSNGDQRRDLGARPSSCS